MPSRTVVTRVIQMEIRKFFFILVFLQLVLLERPSPCKLAVSRYYGHGNAVPLPPTREQFAFLAVFCDVTFAGRGKLGQHNHLLSRAPARGRLCGFVGRAHAADSTSIA